MCDRQEKQRSEHQAGSRYIIGIDLGTTNSSVTYIDTHKSWTPQRFAIPQISAPGIIERLSTLPSFCYLPAPYEFPPESMGMPWQKDTEHFVGIFARHHGGRAPLRLVSSAKSWLCNSTVTRTDPILPLVNDEMIPRISPQEATKRYLAHICSSWNHHIAKREVSKAFEEQDIVLTVPASFDEVARTLTVEAAHQAGYEKLSLLEEPQAALYSWIARHEKVWHETFCQGDHILVVDIGGGTTDFSIVTVTERGLQRMAVGDHLLLGGDNMDNALAVYVEKKLGDHTLSSEQWKHLVNQVRYMKEALLSTDGEDSFSLVIHGVGSSVIGGSMTVTITRNEVEHLLLTGFFGQYPLSEARQRKKNSGVRSLGLPYEAEPSITKQLAAFLQTALPNGTSVDYILFNGGALHPPAFRHALCDSLSLWYGPDHSPQELSSSSLDLAVSHGAAYFGKARRGHGVRIASGIPRTYYIEVGRSQETDGSTLLTIASRGTGEGVQISDRIFSLTPNAPVSFTLWTSHTRLDDKVGDILTIDADSMKQLPALHTLLRYGAKHQEKIPVRLQVSVTEIGTLEIKLVSVETSHRWTLAFQLRSADNHDDTITPAKDASSVDEILDEQVVNGLQQTIAKTFSLSSSQQKTLFPALEKYIGKSRWEWSPATLRTICQEALSHSDHRLRSPEHEARWWNAVGFSLRPGFGCPLDDFRIKAVWKAILHGLAFPKAADSVIQQLICYRRIAGGLVRGQQHQLANELFPTIVDRKNKCLISPRKGKQYEHSERIRTLAAMERIPHKMKSYFGSLLVDRIAAGDTHEATLWALSRIGTRQLLYGSIADVVPPEQCLQWVATLSQQRRDTALIPTLIQLTRPTGQREIDIPNLTTHLHNTDLYNPVLTAHTTPHTITPQEQNTLFGDRLPIGLFLEGSALQTSRQRA